MNISKRISDLRKEKDLSQTDLSTQSGVSREMIGKYERAEAVPSIEAAKKIADAFGVSLDYLVGEGTTPLLIRLHSSDYKTYKNYPRKKNLTSTPCSMPFC